MKSALFAALFFVLSPLTAQADFPPGGHFTVTYTFETLETVQRAVGGNGDNLLEVSGTLVPSQSGVQRSVHLHISVDCQPLAVAAMAAPQNLTFTVKGLVRRENSQGTWFQQGSELNCHLSSR